MQEKVFAGRPGSPTLEEVADGVWLLRGDIKGSMNIYFLRDGDGVVQFDAGTEPMVKAAGAVAHRLGGLKQVVIGHADSDHRGTAPFLAAPVYCHQEEVSAMQAPGPYRDYWDMSKLTWAPGRWVYPMLHRRWDSGPAKVAGTVSEGDDVAGFKVVDLPGHAPGLIGLWRESDRLMICSDAVYFVDSERLKALPEGEASVPHPAWNWNTETAKESIRKLVAMEPATIMAGHEDPHSGPGLKEMLAAAAEKH